VRLAHLPPCKAPGRHEAVMEPASSTRERLRLLVVLRAYHGNPPTVRAPPNHEPDAETVCFLYIARMQVGGCSQMSSKSLSETAAEPKPKYTVSSKLSSLESRLAESDANRAYQRPYNIQRDHLCLRYCVLESSSLKVSHRLEYMSGSYAILWLMRLQKTT
jgi:hypothetical protein